MATLPAPPHALASSARYTLIAALFTLGSAAQANDRPFESARTAVAEDEGDEWSFESWGRHLGRSRSLAMEAEYSFSGRTSVQLEASKTWAREGGREHELEMEFKHLLRPLGQGRWGWGISLAAATEHGRPEDEDDAPAPRRTLTLKLPVSVRLGPNDTFLHLNAGVIRPMGERPQWTRSMALQTDVLPRATLFGEWARDGHARWAQVGVRVWLGAHKTFAIDLAAQRHTDAHRAEGFSLGLGWYDL